MRPAKRRSKRKLKLSLHNTGRSFYTLHSDDRNVSIVCFRFGVRLAVRRIRCELNTTSYAGGENFYSAKSSPTPQFIYVVQQRISLWKKERIDWWSNGTDERTERGEKEREGMV